jgi:hypothetical protein
LISLLLGITILTFAVKTETRWAEDEFNYPNGLYENILEEIVIIGVAIAAGKNQACSELRRMVTSSIEGRLRSFLHPIGSL